MLPFAISASEITPIVFWASLVPWASATIDDEATWPQRNSRSARSSLKRRMKKVDGEHADRRDQPGEDQPDVIRTFAERSASSAVSIAAGASATSKRWETISANGIESAWRAISASVRS